MQYYCSLPPAICGNTKFDSKSIALQYFSILLHVHTMPNSTAATSLLYVKVYILKEKKTNSGQPRENEEEKK